MNGNTSSVNIRLLMNTNTSSINVRLLEQSGELTALIAVPRVVKSEAAWRAHLTDEQFRVTRTHGTERPFCGLFHDNHKDGSARWTAVEAQLAPDPTKSPS